MDGMHPNQNPETFSNTSGAPQQGVNQSPPYNGANVPLNEQLQVVPSNNFAQTNGYPPYANWSNNVPYPPNDYTRAPSYLNVPPASSSSPYIHQHNWNQQYPAPIQISLDDARASVPAPHQPQFNQQQYSQSSSSPIVNIHIHKYYVKRTLSLSRNQPTNGANSRSTTQAPIQSQPSSRIQQSAPIGSSIQSIVNQSLNIATGYGREPQLFVSSGTSTPSHNTSHQQGSNYAKRYNSSPSVGSFSSPRVQELPNSTPTHHRTVAHSAINELPSSPFPTNANRSINSSIKSSAPPAANQKPPKRKFKMSMADVESTIGTWSENPKAKKRNAGCEQKPSMPEKKPDIGSTISRADNEILKQSSKKETVVSAPSVVMSSAPHSHDRSFSNQAKSAEPIMKPVTQKTGSEVSTTTTPSQEPIPPPETSNTQVTNKQLPNPVASHDKALTSSGAKSSTAQTRNAVVIELSDDNSDEEPPKAMPPPPAPQVAPESSIIIIDSDDDEEDKPVEPTQNIKNESAIDSSLISSPIQVMPRVEVKDASDSIADSSFSFTKVESKPPPIVESKEPTKANPKPSETKGSRIGDHFDLPDMPAFVLWLSSEDEEDDLDVLLGGAGATKKGARATKSLLIQKENKSATSNLKLKVLPSDAASRSKSVPDSRFTRPAIESSLKPIKRSNTTQDVDKTVPKKAKRSKTDSLLDELPKIDNFEYSYKELQEANKVSRKKEEIHAEMELFISLKPYEVLKEFDEDFKLKVSTFDLDVPLIYWKRNVKAEYIKEKDYFIPTAAKKVVQQTFVMYYLAEDFLEKLPSNELRQDVAEATEDMCKMATHMYHAIIVVEGYDQFINKIKSYKQRQFRSQVLNGEEQARRKKDDERMGKFPEPLEIAKLVNRAQLDLKINIFPVRSRQEAVMWLNSFTYTIGSSLYDKYERNQGLANLGVVRSGTDTSATFLQSMQHFPRMTQSKAQILQASYKSMHLIYSKFRSSGTLGKDALGRNIVPPTVDSAMLNFFTSDDPDKAIT